MNLPSAAAELASLIANARSDLIERWTQRVLADPSVPEANRLSRPELIDHVPHLVDQIVAAVQALGHGESRARRDERSRHELDTATAHGAARASAGYDLRAAMRELAVFRTVLLELCVERGMPLVGPTAIVVHRVIDDAFGQAATTMEQAFTADLEAERDEARRANAQKDEFLAFMSHEVRNVLNVILGWSRMAASGDERVVRKALEVIDRNAKVLLRLVGDLLEFRRTEMGKLRLHFRPLDVCATLDVALDAARPRAVEKGLSLELRRCPERPIVAGDAERLAQVFGNLLDNAIKFTPAPGRIDTWIEPRERDVVIAFRDTGQGIAPEMIETIFEPYRQAADAPGATRKNGLGLGLALVREIVERHGGGIHVESSGPDTGAVFLVTLPRQDVRDESVATRPVS